MKIQTVLQKILTRLLQLEFANFKQDQGLKSKIKIILHFIQTLSLINLNQSTIMQDNYLLWFSQFLSLQGLLQSKYVILIFFTILHCFFLALIFLLPELKSKGLINILRNYISLYDWCFFIPFQVAGVGNNDIKIVILKIILIILSLLTYLFCITFSRDPAFNSQNGRTQNIYFDLIYLILFETLIGLTFFNNIYIEIYYIITFLLLLIRIIQIPYQNRFTNSNTQQFYIISLISIIILFFQSMMIDLFNYEADKYYFTFLLIIPFQIIYKVILNQQIFKIEHLIRLIINQDYQINNIKVLIILENHIQNCKLIKCNCQILKNILFQRIDQYLQQNEKQCFSISQIYKNQLNKFIVKLLKSNSSPNYLQIMAFQISYEDSGYKNYLQLMKICSKHINFSLYEKAIFNSYTHIIKDKTQNLYNQDIELRYKEIIFSLQWFEQHQEEVKNKLNLLVSQRINLWTEYIYDKIDSYQQFYEKEQIIDNTINQIQKLFFKFKIILEQQIQHSTLLDNNLFYQRVLLIFELSNSSLNKFQELQTKIQKLINYEESQIDFINYLMFETQQAMQVQVIISKEERGQIANVSNKWETVKDCKHLNELMPDIFQQVHSQLLDNYCKYGPSKPQIFQSFFKSGEYSIIQKVKICINTFPIYNDKLYLSGTLIKSEDDSDGQDYFLVDEHFIVIGISENLSQKLFYINIIEQQMNIFQLIPDLQQKLLEHYETMKQLNQEFSFYEKIILYSQIGQLRINRGEQKTESLVKDTSTYISLQDRIDIIKEFDISQSKQDLIFEITYTVSENCIQYIQNDQKRQFIYYWVSLQVQHLNKNNFEQYQSQNTQIKKKDEAKLFKFNQTKVNKSITASRSSTTKQYQQIYVFHQILQSLENVTKQKTFILFSSLLIAYFIISYILMFIIMREKYNQQTQCFTELQYSGTFLEYYGRIMIGSRHVIYMRDFNKFLSTNNIYVSYQGQNVNVSSADKISYSLYIYKDSISNLLKYFESNIDKISIYYEQDESVELIRINYKYTELEIQILYSLGDYYQLMISIFYMAIKTFAANPSLYLQGKTDTYAQVNTRSILYFNFKRVTNITLNFMETCRLNDKVINSQIDTNFNLILIITYVIFFILLGSLLISFYQIQSKRRSIFSLFSRCQLQDALNEVKFLIQLQKLIISSQIWFGLFDQKDDDEENYAKQIPSISGKQIKSHISHHLSNFIIVKIIVPLIITLYGSMIIIQINYIDYSNNLRPLISAALDTLYNRLIFLDTINNWDVYVNKKFYKAMIDIQSNATGNYKIYSENIRHGYLLLDFIGVDESTLKNNIQLLQTEPYTSLISQQSNNLNQTALLYTDLCLLSEFQCDMMTILFFDRVYNTSFANYYKVGVIDLFKSTIQVMIENDFFDLTDNYEIIEAFQKLEKSQSYFFYFLWGFDATLYQNQLFSDYFISLSTQTLQQLSFNLNVLFGVISLTSLLLIIIILILGNLATNQLFQTSIQILYQIPKETIINRNLGFQLRKL